MAKVSKMVPNRTSHWAKLLVADFNRFMANTGPLLQPDDSTELARRVQDLVDFSRQLGAKYGPTVAETQPEPEI